MVTHTGKTGHVFAVRAHLPTDRKSVNDLVRAHTQTDPTYAPQGGITGDEWLARGVGPCLTRIVAVDTSGSVIGHIAVGWIPHSLPQGKLFRGHTPEGVALAEIRRGVVHPDWIGEGVGGELSKAAMRWVKERGYAPVAATLPDRNNSNAMLEYYHWRRIAETIVDGYGVVHLWVPTSVNK